MESLPWPKVAPRWTFATLCDPKEVLPPSSVSTLKYWARIAARLGVEVDPIGARDLSRLANYDALFIRETTTISNQPYLSLCSPRHAGGDADD